MLPATDQLRAYVQYLRDLGIHDLYRQSDPLPPEELATLLAEFAPAPPAKATPTAQRPAPTAAPAPRAASTSSASPFAPQRSAPSAPSSVPMPPASAITAEPSARPSFLEVPIPKPTSFDDLLPIPQDRIAPILAVMVAGVVAQLPTASPEEQCRAAIACLALVSLITGVILYLLGRFKMGDLLQYIPYPVIGGFLAGSGWLLAVGAFRVMVGHPITFAGLPELLEPGLVMKWIPGLVFGAVLFAVMKRAAHPLIPATMLLVAIALFYIALALADSSLAAARDHDWLPATVHGLEISRFPGYGPFDPIPWLALGHEFNIICTILITSVVSVLLTASALELATRQEVDINQELRAAGLATSVASAGGGMVGFHSLSLSRLAASMGASNRWVGVISGGICGLALLVGPSLISYLPRYVCGGLLFFLGLMFLWEWVVEARHTLNRVDHAVVLLILGVIGTLGYTQGIITGVVAAIILFIHNYSRVDVVTNTLSGAQLSSNVDRPVRFVRELKEQGQAIPGYLALARLPGVSPVRRNR